jgi:TonB family protein
MTYFIEKIEKEYYLKSLLLHSGIVIMLFFIPLLMKSFRGEPKAIIVREAVRVDVVAMPKFTVNELKQINVEAKEEQPAVKEESPSKNNSDIELKKEGKVDLTNLLSNLSKRKVSIKAKRVKPQKKSYAGLKNLENLVLEGNKLSKGTALVGDLRDQGRLEDYESYAVSIVPSVRRNWKLPSYLLDKDYKCRIKLYIDENGKIIGQKLIVPSENSEFNQRAMTAVRLSSPLPIPPKVITSKVKVRGVVLAFPIL